ncbi:MAG TPA: MotA/TolQ/ExbB proton channel family protein [Planctomycetota bacterium]|nr:MotA/TolQ/ExbB proton channel family protein [Planctomycetota bacterium]
MNALLEQALTWWRGGDILMPVMFTIAVVLYTLLAERSVVLWSVRRNQRRDELFGLLREGHAGERDGRWRAWAARYVSLAEEMELSRGFTVIRALTASLPLLGLLGTVTGMVDTFTQLGMAGMGAGVVAQTASAGIGLALTATQYGMALAIPAVAWEWALGRRVVQLAQHREAVVRDALSSEDGQSSRLRPALRELERIPTASEPLPGWEAR